jgi:branched-chain amino acid transport system permease protein
MTRLLPSSPRARAAVLTTAGLAALLLVTEVLLPGPSGVAGRGTPAAILFSGLVLGSIAALTATGIVLLYRTIRIVNFAQTAIGSAGAAFVFETVRYVPKVPFPIVFLGGVLIAGSVGVIFDLLFGRRFFNAPRLVLTVVTIAAGAFLGGFSSDLVRRLPFFPPLRERQLTDLTQPGGLRPYLPLRGFTFHVGGLPQRFGFPDVLTLELAVVALVLVALFLRFTRTGVAVRALAENSDRARLLGISVGTMTTIVWIIASVLSGLSVTMAGLVANPTAAFGFAPALLLPPLAAAVIARMESLPVAVVAAIALEVLSAAIQWSFPQSASLIFNVGLLLVICAGFLLIQGRRGGRSEQAAGTWEATQEQRPIPKELAGIGVIRVTRVLLVLIVLAVLGVLPFVLSVGRTNIAGVIAINAIVGLSIVVLTGWAGQISLGQYGFVGIAALVGGALTAKTPLPFWAAVPITVAVTAGVAVLIGIPALRVRGLFLAVSTFVFAVAVQLVLLDKGITGKLRPSSVERPTLFFLNFEDERSMYFLCLFFLAVSCVVVMNLRRSRTGRILFAVRENEANVQSFGISATRAKLVAFAISGGLCGLAGVLYAHQQRAFDPLSFRPDISLNLFVVTVIGGVGSIAGGVIGAVYFGIVQYFLSGNLLFGVIAGFAPLLILYIAPGGIVGVLTSVRDAGLRIVAQRRQIVVPSLFADFDAAALERRLVPLGDPLTNSGLAALPQDQRYTKRSELYRGHGQRILERLASPKLTAEAAAIGAAADSVGDEPVAALTTGADA